MIPDAKWIWLNETLHPDLQTSPYTDYCDRSLYDGYCVAEIARAYRLMKTAVRLKIDISADTVYRLWVNGKYVGAGPVYSGGDNGSMLPSKYRYYTSYSLDADPETLTIRSLVRKNPTCGAESSQGRGGFVLSCEIEYDDGTRECVFTDDKWDIRLLPSQISDRETNLTIPAAEWEKAGIVEYPAALLPSPIPPLSEEQIFPEHKEMLVCPPYSSARFCVEFDRIYSAYLRFSADGSDCVISAGTAELGDEPSNVCKVTVKGHADYGSMQYMSIGKVIFDVCNNGADDVKIYDTSLLFRHYPITKRGGFLCSDDDLNNIYTLCSNTLDICRQDLHLDSPTHREPLGCTGDYYIQALMEYFVFGDSALTRFDIIRTGEYLASTGGRMFHTSYSLIWLMMIRDYYMYTADLSIFDETEPAMNELLERFATYTAASGIVEKAPNYMFVDWMNIDGFNLHHPPKALGQAVLTAFYYNALDIASWIYAVRGNNKLRSKYRIKADAVKKGFNDNFYDSERDLYFAGLGTPDKTATGQWLPENVNKKYFTRHANALAVLFGLCEGKRAERIAERVASDKTLGDIQPYYMHFILDVVYKYGLFEKYGLKLIRRWQALYDECPKGLAEGWGDFHGDHSHAWGGTPAYQIPRALLGFEMIKPGFEEIRLSPKLYGLEFANISMPTPFGYIECLMQRGKKPEIIVPAEIIYTVV